MNESYITVPEQASDEIVIQKSRFIGYACPCSSEEEAIQFIRTIREMHREARHHCFAYIIGMNSGIIRYSDDGEPNGTAGLPILNILKNEKIVNCCVVVVRYFGGVLLGTGGLSRAYSQGCKIALDAAGLVQMELSSETRCLVSYSLWNTVQFVLQKMNVKVHDVIYHDKVEFLLDTRTKDFENTVRILTDKTDGKISFGESEKKYIAWGLPS
jgi:uncharacterized YigZ family protein